jgi:Transposase DDE domain
LASFAYCTNYLIDLRHAVIMVVEATTAVRRAEVTARCIMIEPTQERFGVWPERLAADARYGLAENLAWLVHERGIEPHIPVFDKSARSDGSFGRSDFTYDHQGDRYVCPAGKELKHYHRSYATPRPGVDKDGFMRYRASKRDCDECLLKPRCCPGQPARKIPRSIHEGAGDKARDLSVTDAYLTSRRERKKIEMLFAHLKRILKLDRLRLRGPNGARDEFLLAATAQNLRKLAKLFPIAQTAAVGQAVAPPLVATVPMARFAKCGLLQQNLPRADLRQTFGRRRRSISSGLRALTRQKPFF